jgi:hypothetical protein
VFQNGVYLTKIKSMDSRLKLITALSPHALTDDVLLDLLSELPGSHIADMYIPCNLWKLKWCFLILIRHLPLPHRSPSICKTIFKTSTPEVLKFKPTLLHIHTKIARLQRCCDRYLTILSHTFYSIPYILFIAFICIVCHALYAMHYILCIVFYACYSTHCNFEDRYWKTDRKTDRLTDRLTDWPTDRQNNEHCQV